MEGARQVTGRCAKNGKRRGWHVVVVVNAARKRARERDSGGGKAD